VYVKLGLNWNCVQIITVRQYGLWPWPIRASVGCWGRGKICGDITAASETTAVWRRWTNDEQSAAAAEETETSPVWWQDAQ